MSIECWRRSYEYFKLQKCYQKAIGGMDSSLSFPGFPNKEYIDNVNLTREKLDSEREYIQNTCPHMFQFMGKVYNFV